jgi:DNA-binding NarL/FixJ family response regulator
MDKVKNPVSIGIAIVEDDVPAREIIAGWIRSADGFKLVGEYDDAETAIADLPQRKPSVVLFDINLPGMNGIECVRKLKPRLPETQFLMVTVYEDANHIFDALAVGASGYLLKQTRRSELIDALKDVHAGGSPMSSQIARKVVQSFRRNGAENATGTDGEGAELSNREREVLELLARGYLYKEIAEQLKISVPTVNTYIRRVYEKLHVRSRAQAVAKYAHLPMGHTH